MKQLYTRFNVCTWFRISVSVFCLCMCFTLLIALFSVTEPTTSVAETHTDHDASVVLETRTNRWRKTSKNVLTLWQYYVAKIVEDRSRYYAYSICWQELAFVLFCLKRIDFGSHMHLHWIRINQVLLGRHHTKIYCSSVFCFYLFYETSFRRNTWTDFSDKLYIFF